MAPDLPLKINGKHRILLAPLDWGLGHATRCIPLVRLLLEAGAEPWLAGEGAQEELLKQEFPGIPFLPLPGYRIRYAKTGAGMAWKMIQQMGRIKHCIREEEQWLKKMVAAYGFDAVISDNRYGLRHDRIPSVFITHQLAIRSGKGKWIDAILQKWNYRYIARFSQCWVPDYKQGGLAGDLSHPQQLPPVPVEYIGPLSRFQHEARPFIKGRLLFLLSGPEPQRSLLEEKIIADIAHYPGSATIVRGLPGSQKLIPSSTMIQFYNHLDSASLQKEISEAEYIISRSGYSTVMDAMAMQKKCIFIPTPGQTEQEYLAKSLMEKKFAPCMDMNEFRLDKALSKAAAFDYRIPEAEEGSLRSVVRSFLATLPVKRP